MKQKEISVKSSFDGTLQPSLFFEAEKENRPLLVGLHTWSYNRFNQIENMLPLAEKLSFNLLLPEFRGSNLESNPDCKKACGSEAAKQDIKDAIDYVLEEYKIDKENIFLLGLSGGGHMALLMAGFCPEYFKAIGAFVPITDLEKWSAENPHYAPDIFACCDNDPEEMKKRSPMSYLDTAAKANLKIFHGKHDPVVPVSQSVDYFSLILEKHPEASVYLDVFDGGHEIDMETAEYWIMSKYKKKNKTAVTG
jgi:dipeptidyl aminopeptidase/acylaminoacyl peptidase